MYKHNNCSNLLSLADKKRLAAEREQNLRLRSQPNILQPINARASINNGQSTNYNSLWPDPFEPEPHNPSKSFILPSQPKSSASFRQDPFETKSDNLLESFILPNQSTNNSPFWPDSSGTEPNSLLTSFMIQNQPTNINSLWPDPFKMEPDKSSASFLLKPAFNEIILPSPPAVQNSVTRSSLSEQKKLTNRTTNVSLNESNQKINMSALDDIVCFPTKLNTKNNFSLNSKHQTK
ncbi:Atrochrysone carboxylic acid synthase [Dirofilaria immitis]